jgi:membrane-associated protease RseP (regulator of RpoE activity)
MTRPALVALASLLSGCVTVASVESDSLGGAPAYEEAPAGASAAGEPQPAFAGLELEESVRGTLDSLEFLGGLRVAAVAPGSPAEAAGIAAGDRVLKAAPPGGSPVELQRLDQWSALLAAAKPGDEIRITVERSGGLVDVPLRTTARATAVRPPARRFVERRKARCVVETETVAVDGRTISAARVVELPAGSPLLEAGLAPGARLLALDGVELRGAADFARRVSALPWGEEVELDVLDDGGGGERRRTVEAELFEPDRKLTAIQLWPLFAWAEPADEARTDFEIVDLWLIWLFKYERRGATRHYNILRFIDWSTGVGALTDESGGAR